MGGEKCKLPVEACVCFFSPPPVGREKCKGKNASLPLKPGHVGPNNFENDFANVEL